MTVVERMIDLLRREREALQSGDASAILACAGEKESILPELTVAEISVEEAEELGQLNRFNGELAKGGVSLLRAVMGQDAYGPNAKLRSASGPVIERSV